MIIQWTAKIFLFLFLTNCAYADTVRIDTTNWTKSEINSTIGSSVVLLFDNGVTYDDISFDGTTLTVANPSGDISRILTSSKILAKTQADEVIRQARRQVWLDEQRKRQAFYKTSRFKDINIDDVDSKINACFPVVNGVKTTNANCLNKVLLRLIKYLSSRNYFND